MLEGTFYPLTSPQLSIWYTENIYPGTSISNVAGTMRIKDSPDYVLLEKAINLLIKNNDAIRLHIHLDDQGLPVQSVSDYSDHSIEFKDFSFCDDPEKEMYAWNESEICKPFQLIGHDLFRFVIFKLNSSEGGYFINTHHIISDGWSMGLLGSAIIRYYYGLKYLGRADDYLKPSYSGFIHNEALYKESARYKNDRLYWESQFSSCPEVTMLKPGNKYQSSTLSKRKTFKAPHKFIAALKDFCSKKHTTPYPLFISALFLYINRVTGKEDIIIGTPMLNRHNLTDKQTMGMFINTIPLRMTIQNTNTFNQLWKSVMDICLSALRHQRYPYEELLRFAREKYGITYSLFDIVLSYQNSKFERECEIDFSTRWHFSGHQTNSLSIHINDRDGDGDLIIDYDYQSSVYFEREIEFIHQHVLTLLWHAINNPDKEIRFIEMLTESEKRKVLIEFNHTVSSIPDQKTIHQLYEEQVDKTPHHIALIDRGSQLTYKELNDKANSLAQVIKTHGVMADDLVGIMINRSAEMVVAMMATLKAGAAYLPIDPEYPVKRIQFMLEDSGIKMLLTKSDLLADIELNQRKVVDLADPRIYSSIVQNPKKSSSEENLAYIIYTSGSTGKPKGSMIQHASAVNFVYGMYSNLDFNKIDTVLAIGSFSFDILLIELLPALLKGAAIVIADETQRNDPKALSELIVRYKVDLVVSTPSQMGHFIQADDFTKAIKGVYEIVLGGEAVTESLIHDIRKATDALILNVYGPTETTVVTTTKELSKSGRITIGKPINNTKVYILDKNMLPVPIGIEGEIYIGGKGVGKGYINRPSLTREKFIESPFNPGEMLYKTGDMGRWFAKGEIDYLGRIDSQVKIRGLRIELGEIENKIMMMSRISKAVVTAEEYRGRKLIFAYYSSGKGVNPNTIRNHLIKYLPAYMIPSAFIKMDAFPLSPNGKIDIKALPMPNRLFSGSKRPVKPRNTVEQEVLTIWQNILKDSSFGIHDEFCSIGGDSLSIIHIAMKVYAQFNVNIPISKMNEMITVAKMAAFIDSSKAGNPTPQNIIQLKAGSKYNLFLVHAGNGEIVCYQELACHLAEEFSVWAISCDDHMMNRCQSLDIHALSKEYIDIMKSVQPSGPYSLAGWCIGGSIAFEMTRILESSGESVNSLMMFNTIAPQNWWTGSIFNHDDELNLVKKCLKAFGYSQHVQSVDQSWQFLIDQMTQNKFEPKSLMALMPESISSVMPLSATNHASETAKYLKRIIRFHKMRTDYIPGEKINAPVRFFSALQDVNIKNPRDNLRKWSEYCTIPIQNYNLQCNHYSILSSPSVFIISNLINQSIENDLSGIGMDDNG